MQVMSKQDWLVVPEEGRADWHPRIADFWRYLNAKRPGGPWWRSDLDPVEIPRLLPGIWMLDILGPPLDFRYRLVGTKIVDSVQMDNTGRLMSEVYPNPLKTIPDAWARLTQVAETGRPTWRRGVSVASRRETRDSVENLVMALIGADGRPAIILGYTIIYRATGEEF